MFASASALFLLLFLVHTTKAASAKCYFPDNQVAAKDTPCTSDTVSICCQAGATCLNNGLCFDPFGSAVGGYIRGSCTDKTWASSSCPQYCTYDNATAGLYNSLSDAGVLSCGNQGFCCESDPLATCNCQTGDGVFTISGNLKPFTTIASSGSTTSTSAKTTSTKSPTTTTSSSAKPPTTKSSSTSFASSSPTNTSPAAAKDNTALKVGLGVGLPLTAALVGALGVLAYFLRKRQRQQKEVGDPASSVRFIPPTGPTEYLGPNEFDKPDPNKIYEAPASESFAPPRRVPTEVHEAPGSEVYRDHELP